MCPPYPEAFTGHPTAFIPNASLQRSSTWKPAPHLSPWSKPPALLQLYPHYHLTSYVHSQHEPFKMPSPFLATYQNFLNHSKLTWSTTAKGPSLGTPTNIKWCSFLGASVLPLVPLITDCCPAGQLLVDVSDLLIKLHAPFECRNHVVFFLPKV